MAKDPYAFFRGTCHLFYENLKDEKELPDSPQVWICGDLHMENFGTFKGDNRLVYFDLNDFDEAILAPAIWEIVRFVSSMLIAFETLKIEKKKALNMATLFLKKYSETLTKGRSLYIEPQTAEGIVKSFLESVNSRDQRALLKKRTVKHKSQVLLKISKKHLLLEHDLKKELELHLTDWILNNSTSPYNFEVIDIAFRRAGLGSLGLKRYLALLKSTNEKENFMVIDMKEARRSSLSPYIKIRQPKWNNEAERIISIQQRMQNVPPALLSTTTFRKKAYVLQELQPTKDRLNFDLIKHDYRHIYQAINDMATLTASSQLRSSGRQGSVMADELIAFGENKSWQDSVIDIAVRQTKMIKENFREFSAEHQKADRLKVTKGL
jgi:uncharacterized protein (DUF2252 family)